MKKIFIYFLVLSLVGLSACSFSEQTTKKEKPDKPAVNEQGLNSNEETQGKSEGDVIDRYSSFEARIVCELAQAGQKEDGQAILEVMAKTKEIASQFGFAVEEIRPLTDKYKDNEEFMALTQSKVEEICPEEILELKNNNEGN